MTTNDFARATRFLVDHDIDVRAFVLLRPPFLSESEGIDWALRSIEFACDCGATCVSVIPTRSGNGLMDRWQADGWFSPPRLTSLEQVLEAGIAWHRGRVFADLWDVEQFAECTACASAAHRTIAVDELVTIRAVADRVLVLCEGIRVMSSLSVDVAIVGGGFGGSLLALVLHRAGLQVALIDRGQHPRFAIGESSTPIANLVLSDLCREYDLPRIAPLAKYGSWQAVHPHLVSGIKRGFSYFHHEAGQPFAADADHSTELLVAASSSDEQSDTHWLRQDVDAYLFGEARTAGVSCFEQTEVAEIEPRAHDVLLSWASITSPSPWGEGGRRPGEGREVNDAPMQPQRTSTADWFPHPSPLPGGEGAGQVRTRFVVDASGEGGFLAKRLRIDNRTHELQTNSRAVFAHFADVTRWKRCLETRGIETAEHPFDCDHAALHHVFDGGWMWQLRFNDETVSAGFVQDLNCGERLNLSASAEWESWLRRYPSVGEQYANAKIVRPESGLRSTGRLQRKLARAAGAWWALLPNTAGFIDALHSSGIAHTLCGIERLARILIQSLGRDDLEAQLREYERRILAEVELIDLLVSNCFVAMGEFRAFAAASMLYFAAATSYERATLSGIRLISAGVLAGGQRRMAGSCRATVAASPRGHVAGDNSARSARGGTRGFRSGVGGGDPAV